MIIDYFRNITFGQPLFFLLFALFPFLIWYQYRKGSPGYAAIKVSTLSGIKKTGSIKNIFYNIPFWLRMAALSSMIIALARPQIKYAETFRDGEGIDIILCIDVSGSMTMQDFKPNRIEAAKMVAMNFVNHRQNDRIGVVTFAGEAFTQCPLTTDHYVVMAQLQQIRIGLLVDGTAIGDGLAKSVERLRDSKAKSKVIVLLTDGVNNTGLIDPAYAREMARVFQMKVYTIGIGSNDPEATMEEVTPMGKVSGSDKVGINEKLLKSIATETGGKYYSATDNKGLEEIYKDINQLEKSKVQITTFHRYNEKYFPFIFLALAFLFLETILRFLVFKKFP